jgi:hypothetical protein
MKHRPKKSARASSPGNHPAAMAQVRGLIRAEKARLGLSWEDLSLRLKRLGIAQTATNLSTKVARGNMSAPLFLALLKVLQVRRLDLDALELPRG